MLRISRIVAITRSTMMSSPSGPATPSPRVSPKLLSASMVSMVYLRGGSSTARVRLRPYPLAYAREQVVLRRLAVDQGPDQLEVLGRPDLALDVQRHPEPPAVRVDLGGVRTQRLVADLEVVAGRDPGGGAVAVVLAILPLLQPLRVR